MPVKRYLGVVCLTALAQLHLPIRALAWALANPADARRELASGKLLELPAALGPFVSAYTLGGLALGAYLLWRLVRVACRRSRLITPGPGGSLRAPQRFGFGLMNLGYIILALLLALTLSRYLHVALTGAAGGAAGSWLPLGIAGMFVPALFVLAILWVEFGNYLARRALSRAGESAPRQARRPHGE